MVSLCGHFESLGINLGSVGAIFAPGGAENAELRWLRDVFGLSKSMDEFDRRLLTLLQSNNLQTYEALGKQLGLSPTAVRRRARRLRNEGIIRADVSLIEPSKFGISVIVQVRFEKESNATYEAFKRRMLATPEISQCYTVSGDVDFIVIGHFADLQAYDLWVEAELLADAAVARSTTNIVYRTVKYDTAIQFA